MLDQPPQDQQTHKKHVKKRIQQLSTIIENGESYMTSPHFKNKDIADMEGTPKHSEFTIKNQQLDRFDSNTKQRQKNKAALKLTTVAEDQNVNINDDQHHPSTQQIIEQKIQTSHNSKKGENRSKKRIKSKNINEINSKEQKESKSPSKKKVPTKSASKHTDFKEDDMIKNIKISLNSIPGDLEIERKTDNKSGKGDGEIKEYEITWNALTFFLDKRIRLQEKLLFFVSVCLVLADIGASLYEFYNFSSTNCFGYESEMEFSDIINIISSVILKLCCINIIMQEITNTLPGNMQIPFLIPLSIMGITPNLQLNQYVYSFTSCNTLNPVMSYRNARTITRLLCYLFIALITFICILVMIIRIEISRQTWKRLKNIGFYVLIGGFFLTLIFIFIFVSVLQINQETNLSLCLDNVTFWIFFLICVFFTVRKLIYKQNPFPFKPTIIQQVNSQAQLYVEEDDIESHRLTIQNIKKPKSNLKKKLGESPKYIEDQVIEAQPKKKNKKQILFSPEVQQEEKGFSFSKLNHKIIQKSVESMTDSPDKMLQSNEKSYNIKNIEDQLSQAESNLDAATSSSTSQPGVKRLKFNSQRRMVDSPIIKSVLDAGHAMEDSQQNSKTSLSKRIYQPHDNLSNSSKSSFNKEETQFLSQNFSHKSLGHIIQDSSVSEFQKKDLELFTLNRPSNMNSLNLICNQNNEHFEDDYKENVDDQNRKRIRSLNKLDDDNDLAEQQLRKYSQPRSDNESYKSTLEAKKKSIFEKQADKQN